MKQICFFIICIIFFNQPIFASDSHSKKKVIINQSFIHTIEKYSHEIARKKDTIDPIAVHILENNYIKYCAGSKNFKLIAYARAAIEKHFPDNSTGDIDLAVIEAKIRHIQEVYPSELPKKPSHPSSPIVQIDPSKIKYTVTPVMQIRDILYQNAYNELPDWVLEKIYIYLKVHTEVILQNQIRQHVTCLFHLPYSQAEQVMWYCMQRERNFSY